MNKKIHKKDGFLYHNKKVNITTPFADKAKALTFNISSLHEFPVWDLHYYLLFFESKNINFLNYLTFPLALKFSGSKVKSAQL